MSRRKENLHPNISTFIPTKNDLKKLKLARRANGTPRPRWTDDDDKELVELVSHYENKNGRLNDEIWTLIGKQLRLRSGRSCKLRYKKVQQRQSISSPSPKQETCEQICQPESYDIDSEALMNNRPHLQWSPFTFSDTIQSSSPMTLNLSPLKLEETGIENDFSKTEVDALLNILIDNNTLSKEVPPFSLMCSPIGRKYLDVRDRYDSVNSLTYSSATDCNLCSEMMKREGTKMSLSYEAPLPNYNSKEEEDNAAFRVGLSTPPIKEVSDFDKYSTVSSLTAPTTKSRKKPRLSPTDEILPKALSHTMPKLSETNEIELVWSQGEPLLCYRQNRSRVQFDIPDHALPADRIYDSDLQALDARASHLKIRNQLDADESQWTTLKPKPFEKNTKPRKIQPSPEVNLQGSDMNRIILGLESPSPTISVTSVGFASPNVFDL